MEEIFRPPVSDSCYRIVTLGIYCCRTERDRTQLGQRIISIRKNVTHFLPRIPANKTRHATNELLKFEQLGRYMWPSGCTNFKKFCWGIYRIRERYQTTDDITDKQLLKLVDCWRDQDRDQKDIGTKYSKNRGGVKDYQVFVLDCEYIFSKPICIAQNDRCYKYYNLGAVFLRKI